MFECPCCGVNPADERNLLWFCVGCDARATRLWFHSHAELIHSLAKHARFDTYLRERGLPRW